MKLLLFILLFILLFTISIPTYAGIWEKLSTISNEEIKPTAQYNIEAPGWNILVIEWVPKQNKHIRCLFAGGSKKGGVACYPIK